MLTFDRLYSSVPTKDGIVFNVISTDNQKYEFTLTRHMASAFFVSLHAAAKLLQPDSPVGRPVIPNMIQPVIGPDIEPGLSIDLGSNLSLELSFPPKQLAALKAAIEQLEAHTKPGNISH